MLRIDDDHITNYSNELIVLDKSTEFITNFFGARQIYADLNQMINNYELETILL
jgi:hypothetical protein